MEQGRHAVRARDHGRDSVSGPAAVHIRVVNTRTASREEIRASAYVGRGSPLGNPFKVKPWGPYDRGSTIPMYRFWLRERLAGRDRDVCSTMNDLYVRARHEARSGGTLLLRCHRFPNPCHADVVREFLLEAIDISNRGPAADP